MSNYVNIKISNADLPKPFIVMNDRMDKRISNDIPEEHRHLFNHWEANGYCAVNRKYACYWQDYNRLCRHDPDDKQNPLMNFETIDIHWGLTFGESLAECKKHFPHIYNAYLQLEGTSSKDDVYIFGFDTHHYGDNESDRSKEAVEAEARRLAKQMLSYYVPTKEEIEQAEKED